MKIIESEVKILCNLKIPLIKPGIYFPLKFKNFRGHVSLNHWKIGSADLIVFVGFDFCLFEN
jgi:hypothetical protein